MTADRHLVEGMPTGGDVAEVGVADEATVEVIRCRGVAGQGHAGDRYRDRLRSNDDTPVIPGR